MKRKSSFILVASLIFTLSLLGTGITKNQEGDECGEDEKVIWLKYDEALKRAREQGRAMVVFFHKDHCRKCELLMESGFNRPEIACYINKELAPVRIKGADNPDIKEKFRVSSYPTVWFLTPEAEEIDFFMGYVKPDKLNNILRYIGDGVYKDKSFEEYMEEVGNK